MFDNLIAWYYRKKAFRGLKAKYRLEIATDVVAKEWITECILHRKQEFRRKELVEMQAKIKEQELFYKWLMAKK